MLPCRVCVQVSLPQGVLVRVEMLVFGGDGGSGRSSLHVQSVSHWAPANIGPYSQAYMVRVHYVMVSVLHWKGAF